MAFGRVYRRAVRPRRLMRRLKRMAKRPRPTRSVIPIRRLPRQVRPEIKKYDNDLWNAETIDNAAAWSFNDHLLLISQGDTVSDRTGNKIFLKWITGKYWLSNSVDAQDARVRIVVILDKEPLVGASVTPTFNSVFQNQLTDLLDLCAPQNLATNGRFRILYNKMHCLRSLAYLNTGVTGTGVSPQLVYGHFKVNINKIITYNANTTTVNSGCQVYVAAYSDRTNNTPQINMVTRTYFTDA